MSTLQRLAGVLARGRFAFATGIEYIGILIIFAGLWLKDQDVRAIWHYTRNGRVRP